MAKNALWALGLILAAVSPLISSEPEQKSLAGISGVNLIVGTLADDALEAGLSAEQLKADVEEKLRLAQIEVDPKYRPYVYVSINSAFPKSASGEAMGYIAMVKVELNQEVYVLDNSHRMYAPTWKSSVLIWGSRGGFQDDVRKRIRGLIDLFVKDFLAANTKKPEKKAE
jgi:hypothetical protein